MNKTHYVEGQKFLNISNWQKILKSRKTVEENKIFVFFWNFRFQRDPLTSLMNSLQPFVFFFQDALFLTAVFNSCLNPLVYGGFYFKALTRRSFGKSTSWRGASFRPDRANRNNIESKLWKKVLHNGVAYFVADA